MNKYDDYMNNIIAPWTIKIVIAMHAAMWVKVAMDILKFQFTVT